MATQTEPMTVESYMSRSAALLEQVDAEAEAVRAFEEAITDTYDYDAGRHIFIIGNGGSGANASHLCEDLGKGTLVDFETQKRMKVMSLTDNTPYILAWGNDTDYSRIFLDQLKNFAEPGLLIAISGSGNSPNIIVAVDWANEHGLSTFGVTGYDGGKLLQKAGRSLHVKSHNMGEVESVHLVAFHYLIDALRERFSPSARRRIAELVRSGRSQRFVARAMALSFSLFFCHVYLVFEFFFYTFKYTIEYFLCRTD